MPVVLGTDRVSANQLRYLEMARRGRPPMMVADFLMRIARDDEILSGEEDLHPDWLELYESVKRKVRGELSPPKIEMLDQFFASAQPYDPLINEINPQSEKISFLLGAGASKPEPSGIPTRQGTPTRPAHTCSPTRSGGGNPSR